MKKEISSNGQSQTAGEKEEKISFIIEVLKDDFGDIDTLINTGFRHYGNDPELISTKITSWLMRSGLRYVSTKPISPSPSKEGQQPVKTKEEDGISYDEIMNHPQWDEIPDQLKNEGYSTGSEEDYDKLYDECKRRIKEIIIDDRNEFPQRLWINIKKGTFGRRKLFDDDLIYEKANYHEVETGVVDENGGTKEVVREYDQPASQFRSREEELEKEIEELNEEIRKLKCWLKYDDWVEANYEVDEWSTNPGPHYFKKQNGKVLPFSSSIAEMTIRREYIKSNNL